MSLKQEIETWVQALTHYDNNEFEESLGVFDNIADTSKILFNCGVIHATLGEHDKAVECFQRAIRLDQYLAVAYFQQGVSNFLVGDFEEALANFNDTLLYLRGNNYIDYEQLGLKFKLYSCEVLFNRGLCYIYLQQNIPGMKDFEFALKEKMTQDHDVIDDAIREHAEGYTVFSIPVGIVYRPNDAKVKNLKTKNYLGQARLVAASDRSNAFTGFAGAEIKAKIAAASSPPIGSDLSVKDINLGGSANDMPFAASHLVDRTLSSRGRQQSEPPMNRNVFPPTPPPEADKLSVIGSDNGSVKGTTRAASVRSGDGRPRQAQRSNTGFDRGNPYSTRDDNGFPPRKDNGFPSRQENGFPPRQQDNGFPPRQDNGFPSRQDNGFPPRQNDFSPRSDVRPPPPLKGKQMGDPMRGPMDDRMGGMGGPSRADQMRGGMDMRGENEDRLGNLPRNQYGNSTRSPMDMNQNQNQNQMNSPMDRPRVGTMRTASEPRGPSRQYPSMRSRDGGPRARPTLFRETTEESIASASSGPSARSMGMQQDPSGQQEDEYRDELFDMYSSSPPARSSRNQPQPNIRRTRSNMQPNRPAYIPEEPSEEPYASDAYSDASLDSTSFDMMGNQAAAPRRMSSRRPIEVKKIRVKVHANDDTRYIMIGPEVQMPAFERKITEKFKLRGAVKIKIVDEGDMVTMADQDDLDVVIQAARSAARRERSDMGKMEVWIVGL